GCLSEESGPLEEGPPRWLFSFDSGDDGWQPVAARFSEADRERRNFGFRQVTAQEGTADCCKALQLEVVSNGRLVIGMFYPLEGLDPNLLYQGRIRFEVFSDVPAECGGIPRPPGRDTNFLVGFSDEQLKPFLTTFDFFQDWWSLNIDHGIPGESGEDAWIVGDFAIDKPCEQPYRTPGFYWERKRMYNEEPFSFYTDEDGTAWAYILIEIRTRVFPFRFPFDWVEIEIAEYGELD
ncbi:hypothetical protein, partial [Natronospira sp.]|uniref:hypothetical protein n=1 Tax=Natronospira sp. TaxID=2024970 RepID=UPI003873A249